VSMSPAECAYLDQEARGYELGYEWAELEDYRFEIRHAEDRAEELQDDIDRVSIPRRRHRWLYSCPSGMGKSPARVRRWQRSRRRSDLLNAMHDAGDAISNIWTTRPLNPYCVGGVDDVIDEVDPDAVPAAERALAVAFTRVDSALIADYSRRKPPRAQRRAANRRRHNRQREQSTAPARTYDADPGPPGRLAVSSPHLANAPPRLLAAPLCGVCVGRLAA